MRILDSDIDLKGNLGFSWGRYRVWWAILLVTIVFDALTTLYFVDKYGIDREGDLVVRWLIAHAGLLVGILAGKSLQLAAVLMMAALHRRLGNLFLLVIILLNCWAVVMNSMI